MKILITVFSIVLLSLSASAQNDSIVEVVPSDVEIYDVVAVYRDGKDGRGNPRRYTIELKGEIINYDESTGFLTFKDVDGRMYSLNSEQYEYFQYDKEFKLRKKKQKVLNPRKDSGIEFSAGIALGFLNLPTGIQFDENFVGGSTAGFDTPVSLKAGVSNLFNKNTQAGLTAEFSLVGSGTTYFNIGGRFQYLYNPNKNAAFYFPVELKYAYYSADYYQYQYNDTIYYPNGDQSWPTDYDVEVILNSLELNVGQGVSFSLKNKRSLSLELMLIRQFILSEEVRIPLDVKPQTDFSAYGAKLAVFMNF